MDDNSSNLQYNSCTSKGICSVNPRTSALQQVLLLYLKLCSKYLLKLYQKTNIEEEIQEFIFNTLILSISNLEFTEENFTKTIDYFKVLFPNIINKSNYLYKKMDFQGENILDSDIFQKSNNITEAIKLGEILLAKTTEILTPEIQNLFKITLVILKSISINTLYLKSYNIQENESFKYIIETFDFIGFENYKLAEIKNRIQTLAKYNIELLAKLQKEQEKRYGTQNETEVSYTTTPAKSILVAGSNIRELETILEAIKDFNIDIYTHDDMIFAHTFPKFKNFKHLKGQYGHGIESCLIDFATFPGPIILTKYSQHNIENLYRGRLYSTDSNLYKGVLGINNNDFSEVIKAAKISKGFKTGKKCESILIGYDFNFVCKKIKNALELETYKKVFIIGAKDFSEEHKRYFEKLIKITDSETLIVSFSYNGKNNNLIHINAYSDSFGIVKIADFIKKFQIPVFIFFPKCGRNTLSKLIYFSQLPKFSVYIGDCEPIMLNPSLRVVLKDIFGISTISSPREDLECLSTKDC